MSIVDTSGKVDSMKLNIGCGTDTFGDVRVDLQRYRVELPNKSKTTANIIASAEALPFPNKVFSEVRCWHVLEHLRDPCQGFAEMKRVTTGILNIRVPIWHFYSLLIETISLFKSLLIHFKHPRARLNQIRSILLWKQRYGDHKWYIRFREAKVRKWFKIIPMEYECAIMVKDT